MRLGSETGSLVNHIMAGSRQPEPFVGMAATVCLWTDRSPATVVLVQGPFIAVRGCIAKGVEGHCNAFTEDQRYTYEDNPEAGVTWFRQMDDGKWQQHRLNVDSGRFQKVKSGAGLVLGVREAYRDPSF